MVEREHHMGTTAKWVDNKDLVIAVSSSALFDLGESDKVYRSGTLESYEEYQKQHSDEVYEPGTAYPFISKLLRYNPLLQRADNTRGVEIIVISRNSPTTGIRIYKSIKHYGLPIETCIFLSGESPADVIKTFNVDLFLSANRNDVRELARQGIPAGRIITDNESKPCIDPHPNELRVAFDFDGIIASDSSETVFQQYLDTENGIQQALSSYAQYETEHANDPIEEGPLAGLLRGLNKIQYALAHQGGKDWDDIPRLKTAIITARGVQTFERALNTIEAHGLHIDQAYMMAGYDKTRILNTIQPDIFFDDQSKNLTPYSKTPSVHIPLGVCNPCTNNQNPTNQ